MQFNINNASNRAAYQQIIDQVKRDIALGRLIKDEKLPTVRELAIQLAINPNTIAKAYRSMEREGIIVTRPGQGAFVSELNSNLSMEVRQRLIGEEIERIVIEAYHLQIDASTLQTWVEDAVKKFNLETTKEEQTDE